MQLTPSRAPLRGWLAFSIVCLVTFAGTGAAQAPFQCGDCNGDGTVSILDSLVASQAASGILVLASPQFDACNVTGVSGGPVTPGATVDVLDSLIIAQNAAGLPVTLDCNADPSCAITAPSGGSASGDILWVFDFVDPDGGAGDVTFEWSSDGGATWNPATAAATSPLANPAMGVSPGMAQSFIWDSAVDIVLVMAAVDLRVTVDDGVSAPATCATSTTVDNTNDPASCNIFTPTSGTFGGNVIIGFDATDPDLDPLTITFEFDAGGGFAPATAAAGSTLANPAVGVPPAMGLSFLWDSALDIPATAGGVIFRVTVDDGINPPASCTTTFDVDNNDPPTCAVTSPLGGMQSGDVTITFDALDPESDPLTMTFEFDAGGGFLPASVAAGSPIATNPAAGVVPGTGLQFIWDSFADVPTFAPAVTFRVTVDDGLAAPSQCITLFTVANNRAPSCTVVAPTSGTQMGDIAILFDALDPDLDPLQISFDFSVGAGFAPCTAAAASPLPNPAVGVPPGTGFLFLWNSTADIPGFEPTVTLRITVDDGVAAPQTCTSTFSVDNNDPPSCSIAPISGTQMGDVGITFNALDPESDPLAITFEFDAGGGFLPATAAGSSPLPNPALGVAPGAGLSFVWNSVVDVPRAATIRFRITVDDGRAAPQTCTVMFNVDNNDPPSCNLVPLTGTQSGDIDVVVLTLDPETDPLDLTFEFDAGGGFMAATAAATSPLPNPASGVPPGPQVFRWNSAADVSGSVMGVVFRVTVDDGLAAPQSCTTTLDINNNNAPMCRINSPVGGTESGATVIDFDAADADMDLLTITFDYDVGAGFMPATADGASALTNPALAVAPAAGLLFTWNSDADLGTFSGGVTFRVTVDDGIAAPQTCTTMFNLDNNEAPSCNITSPAAGTQTGVISIVFDGVDTDADPLDVTFEFDAGMGFMPAAVHASSPLSNPAMGVPPSTGLAFNWDSPADVLRQANVTFRVTVDDGINAPTTCTRSFLVNNNDAPTCNITAPSGTQSGDVTIVFDVTDPEMDPVGLTFEYNAGMGFMPATAAGSSPLSNPAAGVAPGTGLSFVWDSASDALGFFAGVTFRVTVDDGLAAPTTCSRTFDLNNNRAPSCLITAPFATMEAGDVTINFDALDADGDLLDLSFEYNAGAGFMPATAAGGSPLANPATSVTPGAGLTFIWNSLVDVPATAAVTFRVTVDDGLATPTTCSTAFTVDNSLSCNVTSPSGSVESADVNVTFDLASLVPATVDFEYSVDGGATFLPATAAAASAIQNPAAGLAAGMGYVFTWNSNADVPGNEMVVFRVNVDNMILTTSCSSSFEVDNRARCTINLPMTSAMLVGDVTVDFDALDPNGDLVDITFWYSVNGGAVWIQATAAAASPLSNPSLGLATPGIGQVFFWDSNSDIPGAAGSVLFRVTVFDGTLNSECSVGPFSVQNQFPPTCTISAPAAGTTLSGDAALTLDFADPNMDPLDVTVQYSTNGGSTYANCTPAGTSPVPFDVNPTTGVPSMAGQTFVWDTGTDVPAMAAVRIRLITSDGFSAPVICTRDYTVDNRPECAFISPLAGLFQGEIVVTFDATDRNGDPVDITLEFSTNMGLTWAPMTAAPSSPLANPTLGSAGGMGLTFTWNSTADIPAISSPQDALLRVTVDDGVMIALCPAGPITVDNPRRDAVGLRPVNMLSAMGTPMAGPPVPGNPKGDWSGLNEGEFNNTVELVAGGNPVILFQIGDTFQMVLEGQFSQAPALTDVAAATNADGTTFWASDNGNVSVGPNGLLTGVVGNACSEITAVFTPNGSTSFGTPLLRTFQACVDLGGVDQATRSALRQDMSGPNLAVGDLDLDLPGLPSGPVPPAVGGSFELLASVNADFNMAAAYGVQVDWDPSILSVNVGMGTQGIVDSSVPLWGAPTAVNPRMLGAVRWNDVDSFGASDGVHDIGAIALSVVGGGTTLIDPTVETFADPGGMTIGMPTPRGGIAGRGEATFAGGAARRVTGLRPVNMLGATGTPTAGAPSPGNPSGDWAGLNAGEFNNTVSLAAGGNPVILFNVGDTFQLVLEAAFDQAPLTADVAAAVNADGFTTYAVTGSAVTVSPDGLITGQVDNDCAQVTASFTPSGTAVGSTQQRTFAACVDTGGVDRASRESLNQALTGANLTIGDLDADLPGLPSGLPPVAVGTPFEIKLYTNTRNPITMTAADLGVYQIDVGWDPAILTLDVGMGTQGISDSTRPEFGAPTVVNPMAAPGLLIFNDINPLPGVQGANDVGGVNFVAIAAGTTLFTQIIETIADNLGLPIGAATPRLSVAGTGALEFTGAGQIDLTPSNVTGPAMASLGTMVTVDRTVTNAGTLPAAMGYDEKIYLSADPIITTADLELGSFTNGFLGGGAMDMTSRSVAIPTTVPPGTYFYGVIVDTPDAVAESDEANNAAASAGTVMVINDVDLTVTNVTPASTTLQAGQGFNVSRDLMNSGLTPSAGFQEAWYLSTDMVLDGGDTPLSTFAHPPLAAMGSTAFVRGLVLPLTTAPGSYFVLCNADDTMVVNETNEMNNVGVSVTPINVVSIDLVVSNVVVTGPIMLNPLDPTTVSRRLENLGTAASGMFMERVVLSTDTVIDGTDQVVMDFPHPGLAAGGVDMGSLMFQVPAATAPGTYFVGIILDPAGAIAETNEMNNAAASSNTVTVLGAIDLEAVSATGRDYATMGLPRRFDHEVRNNGGSPAPAFNIGYYLSTDATITTGDIMIGSIPVAGLAPGATLAASADLPPLPNGITPGDYFVGIIADWDGMVGESNESNNAVAAPAVTPIIVEVIDLGTFTATLGTFTPSSPLTVSQAAGVTSFALIGRGVYQGSGANASCMTLQELTDPGGTPLLDGSNCPPVHKNSSRSCSSGPTFQVPNASMSEHRECGTGPMPNPSNPAVTGNYTARWANLNFGPAPQTADLTIFNIRKFDTIPDSGTIYVNIVIVGDFLTNNIRAGGDPASGPATAFSGPGAGDLVDILARLQAYYTPINITIDAEVHFVDGAFGNALEVVDVSADSNGNGVADNQEALAESTPLATYEPGNTGLNVFLIRDITSPSGSVAGVASGIPGIPVLQGTPHSGVISSQFGTLFSSTSASGRQVQAEIIAHEMGHELGMFHTTEFSGNPSHDPVPDTLRCLAGTVSPANCAGQGSQYVMFPQAAPDPTVFFTTNQGFIINRNPFVR